MKLTRRGIQLALAGFWLLDAALQFQPYMFTTGFGRDVIAPAGDGQPALVSGPVHWGANVIASHPVLTNTPFAVIQLVIAIGLCWRPSVRAALGASVMWSLGVWWFGEGFNGLLSGHAMLLTGAPGAVLLYAVLAVTAWPSAGNDGRGELPRPVGLAAWIGLWALGALYQLLPGQNTGTAISSALKDAAGDQPGWLATATNHLAHSISHHDVFAVALILLEAAIAATAIIPGATRQASLLAGSALAAGFWAFGQSFGTLFSGQATDPNTGPLILLLAITASAHVSRQTFASPVDAYPREPLPQRAVKAIAAP